MDFSLSKRDTSVLKGFAIIGMMMWHLFFAPNPEGVEFSAVLRFVSIIGDFCVSAFLFISGYGLTISFSNYLEKYNHSKWGGQFVLARLVKFYFNYWFIFLLFVPIGIFFFNIPMITDGEHTVLTWLKQIFALSGQKSYNSAWWFNTLIVKYYILFPFLYFMIRKKPIITLCFIIVLTVLGARFQQFYLVIFVIGIMWAYFKDKKQITPYLSKLSKLLMLLVILFLFISSITGLYFLGEKGVFYRGLPFFGLITIALALFIKSVNCPKIYDGFNYLGKHSGNIYMFHSFLYYYWFSDWFYSLPTFAIFPTLLLSSLIFSLLIERLKEVIMWNKLSHTIYSFILKH